MVSLTDPSGLLEISVHERNAAFAFLFIRELDTTGGVNGIQMSEIVDLSFVYDL